jgi:hypothetical protein
MQRIALGLLAGVALLLAGCGSKVTQENYEKIQTGMTEQEVTEILGAGVNDASGAFSVGDLAASGAVTRWGTDDKHIKVTFANGKVVAKAQKGL